LNKGEVEEKEKGDGEQKEVEEKQKWGEAPLDRLLRPVGPVHPLLGV
jgi:hypothetical protein